MPKNRILLALGLIGLTYLGIIVTLAAYLP